jgi:hypothetical protein
MWYMFGFWVAMKIIESLGYTSWIGSLIVWPLSALAYASFYRSLVKDDVAHHQRTHQASTTY